MKQTLIQTHLDNPGDPLLRRQWQGNFSDMVNFINNEYPMKTNPNGSLEIYGYDGTIYIIALNNWLSKEN